MLQSSIIISFAMNICKWLIKNGEESKVYDLYIKFISLMKKWIENSHIASNKNVNRQIKKSLIMETLRENVIGKKTRNFIGGLFANSIVGSIIVKFSLGKIVFVLVLLAIPFISTTLGIIAMVGTGLIIVLEQWMKNNKVIDRGNRLYILCMGIFFLSAFASTKFNDGNSLRILFIYLAILIFGLGLVVAIKGKKELFLVLNTIVFLTFLVCLFGIYQRIFGAVMDSGWVDEEVFGKDLVRVYSVFKNPNVFGEYLILVLPLIFALFNIVKNNWLKVIYLGVLGLAFLNLLLTLSRGCMISLLIAITLLIILYDRKYLPLLVLGLLMMPFVLPQTIIARFMSIFSGGDSSSAYRDSLFGASINMIKEHYMLGVGLGKFKDIYKIYSYSAAKSFHAHNTIFMIIIEMGLFGIGSFIVLLYTWTRNVIQGALVSRGKAYGYIAVSCLVAIVGVMIQGMTDHIWHNYDIMTLFFIIMAIGWKTATLAIKQGGNDLE